MKYIIKAEKFNKGGYCYCSVDCNDCGSRCSSVCNSDNPNECRYFCGAVIM